MIVSISCTHNIDVHPERSHRPTHYHWYVAASDEVCSCEIGGLYGVVRGVGA